MADLNFATLSRDYAAISEAMVKDFRGSLHGVSLLPGDEGYDSVRRIWNAMVDERPALVSRCSGTADVIKSVNFARENDLLISVRGGGHNGQRGYHPLLAIAAGTGDVLMARLRKGRANTVRGAAHFLREAVGRVRYAGARGQLTVRADSGFYAHAIVAVCRKMDVRYSITARQHARLRNIIEAIPETDWTPISTGYIRLTLQRLIINLIEGGGRYSFPELRQPQPDDRPAHVVHFTAAVYTGG